MEQTTTTCDYGHEDTNVVKLNLFGNSGVFLCRKHWKTEMRWRTERNKDLEPANRFDILPFPEQ